MIELLPKRRTGGRITSSPSKAGRLLLSLSPSLENLGLPTLFLLDENQHLFCLSPRRCQADGETCHSSPGERREKEGNLIEIYYQVRGVDSAVNHASGGTIRFFNKTRPSPRRCRAEQLQLHPTGKLNQKFISSRC